MTFANVLDFWTLKYLSPLILSAFHVRITHPTVIPPSANFICKSSRVPFCHIVWFPHFSRAPPIHFIYDSGCLLKDPHKTVSQAWIDSPLCTFERRRSSPCSRCTASPAWRTCPARRRASRSAAKRTRLVWVDVSINSTAKSHLEGRLAGVSLGVARLLAAELAGLGLGVVGALRALARLQPVRQAYRPRALLQKEGRGWITT